MNRHRQLSVLGAAASVSSSSSSSAVAAPSADPAVRLIRVRDAAARMCVSVSYVYREIGAGRLGPLIKLGERRSALNEAEVERWIAQRVRAAYRPDGGEA